MLNIMREVPQQSNLTHHLVDLWGQGWHSNLSLNDCSMEEQNKDSNTGHYTESSNSTGAELSKAFEAQSLSQYIWEEGCESKKIIKP